MTKRYQHILVPLDGSALAELSQAEVTLLQVVAPIDHVIFYGSSERSTRT